VRDLSQGLAHRQFALEFQPIVDATTHRVVCVEALVRWRHPQRGTIAPADFIGIAESTGQMVEIGEWILHEACRRFREWRDAGIAPRRIAVNVSAVQFRRGDLPAAVASALESSGVPAKHLELEITETAMMANEEETARCLRVMKDLGVRLALDDFGTGYSSLSYLKRFPVDSLKIDQSFVRDLATAPDAQTIAQAIISLAHEIGLTVVGEGVETAEQHRFLVKNGCDELQGYRFSRPLDEKQIRQLLERGVISPNEGAGVA
jgi:EAL domain-containing protein (putative c-di-GMP-specific phosphodiesterase class I)